MKVPPVSTVGAVRMICIRLPHNRIVPTWIATTIRRRVHV